MKPIDVAHQYFDAWNQRNPFAIVATFADGGTYCDPTVPQGVSGPALVAYTSDLFAAFPNLSFEMVSAAEVDDHMVVLQWLMRGTNSGPLLGSPPTGRTVALPGADFITVVGNKVRSVQGYFDQKTFLEQLGLQVIAQPTALGPLAFGTSLSMQLGKRTKPGAFSLTCIYVRSDEEAQRVREYGERIVTAMTQMPGFLSWTGMAIGQRLYTVTAWEKPEDASQLLRDGTHREAMRDFFDTDFSEGGITGVWIPHHLNATWVRCPDCGRKASYEVPGTVCHCGQSLPEPPPYW